MIRGDFHTHTNFCDGKNSAEEMVLAAIDAGMPSIGITTHSYTDFDTSYCIPKERLEAYIKGKDLIDFAIKGGNR